MVPIALIVTSITLVRAGMGLIGRVMHVAIKKGYVYPLRTIPMLFDRLVSISPVEHAVFAIFKRQFRNMAQNFTHFDDTISFSYSFNFFGVRIAPVQVSEEISELCKLVSSRGSRRLMEIGTASGGTLFLFSMASSDDAIMISVDTPGGRFGGGYPKWKEPLYRSFTKGGQRVLLISTDSHDPQTLRRIKEVLGPEKLDFLFIDGDHTYEGVKRDFKMYVELVGDGIVAFHDICPHPPESRCEVSRFWLEIRDSYRYVEIVRDWEQGWGGIGVLYV